MLIENAADVTDAAAVTVLVDEVVSRYGRLNIAVNCAGIAPAFKVVNRARARRASSSPISSRIP
ncbi:MAG: SDR family oxidoreductase [Mycobacterium sp.]